MLERLRRIGLTTVTVLNKDYLYGIFGTRTTRRVHSQATTVDVAPTVGALLGLGTPRGGYDGRSRL